MENSYILQHFPFFTRDLISGNILRIAFEFWTKWFVTNIHSQTVVQFITSIINGTNGNNRGLCVYITFIKVRSRYCCMPTIELLLNHHWSARQAARSNVGPVLLLHVKGSSGAVWGKTKRWWEKCNDEKRGWQGNHDHKTRFISRVDDGVSIFAASSMASLQSHSRDHRRQETHSSWDERRMMKEIKMRSEIRSHEMDVWTWSWMWLSFLTLFPSLLPPLYPPPSKDDDDATVQWLPSKLFKCFIR